MPKAIFINLPVSDVARATAFYEALGFQKNPSFSNEQGSGMVWSDSINLMLLDKALYSTFTPKKIIDAHTETQALFALSFDDRAAVDRSPRPRSLRADAKRMKQRIRASCTAAPLRIWTVMAGVRSAWMWQPSSRHSRTRQGGQNRPRHDRPRHHGAALGPARRPRPGPGPTRALGL